MEHEHEHEHDERGREHDADGRHPDPRAFWEDRYRQRDAVWVFRPNAVLAAEAPSIPPGRALDLGAGEGGDAVWLATLGWTVTAVDISAVALERGAAAATEHGVADRITWERADLGDWMPSGSYDLVTSHFLQSPVALDGVSAMRTAATAVVPGGVLLVVQHAARRHDVHDGPDGEFATADDLAAALRLDVADWSVELAELRPRTASFPDGRVIETDDVVLLMRRR